MIAVVAVVPVADILFVIFIAAGVLLVFGVFNRNGG